MLFLLNAAVSFMIAYFIGRHKRIGFTYTLLLCIFFGSIVGLAVILSSPSKKRNVPYPKPVIPAFFGVLFFTGVIALLFFCAKAVQYNIDWMLSKGQDVPPTLVQLKYLCLSVAVGCIVLIIYLFDRTANPKEVKHEKD